LKCLPHCMSLFGFFVALALVSLVGKTLGISWLMVRCLGDVSSGGFRFEAGIPWIPLALAALASYVSFRASSKAEPCKKGDAH